MIQLTGLSGAGKSTISAEIKILLQLSGIPVEIIDGDVYRKTICNDLGFSKEDRCENIRRLGEVASRFCEENRIAILAVINPYESARHALKEKYNAKTVYVDCDLITLVARDTKGLYHRALLADDDPNKLFNLTGVNDHYDIPTAPDLRLQTHLNSLQECTLKLFDFIMHHLKSDDGSPVAQLSDTFQYHS